MDQSKLPSFSVDADRIGLIQLNDPATLNGLSLPVFVRLREIIAEIQERAASDELRAVILTGSGRGFCAGAELNSIFRSVPPEVSLGAHIARFGREEGGPIVLALNTLPVPLVVAVNGVAAGMGFSIALMGDVVIAAESASFMVPFMTGLGILPDTGLSSTLPRLIGPARATALTLLGEKLPAPRAEAWGLIWRCVPDAELMIAAQSVALKLARLPAYAAREMRELLAASIKNSFEAQYHHELDRNAVLLDGAAFREGLTAFLEKRTPQYRT